MILLSSVLGKYLADVTLNSSLVKTKITAKK